MYTLWFDKYEIVSDCKNENTNFLSILADNVSDEKDFQAEKTQHIPCFISKASMKSNFLNKFLHAYSHFNQQIKLIGSFKNDSSNFQIQALMDMLESGHSLPVYFSHESASYEIFKSLTTLLDKVHGVFIDNSVNQIDELIQMEENVLQNNRFNILGIQKHLCNQDLFHIWEENAFHFIRLGDLKKDIHASEVALRDVHFVDFNLNVIRSGDFPTLENSAPVCGLSIENACQIMRYIGMNPKLKILNISGIDGEFDSEHKYYELLSTLLWYFMDGLEMSKKCLQIENDKKKEFLVQLENLDFPLRFYKSILSDRWWFSFGSEEENCEKFACSADDYQKASYNHLSDRVIKILEKI